MNHIPFLDLNAFHSPITSQLESCFDAVCHPVVLLVVINVIVEQNCFFCFSDFCVGVGNGLDAIKLILKAYDIGYGDEVIVPAHTFIATWLAVSEIVTPIAADISPVSYTIDPSKIEPAISPRTKAIIRSSLWSSMGYGANNYDRF